MTGHAFRQVQLDRDMHGVTFSRCHALVCASRRQVHVLRQIFHLALTTQAKALAVQPRACSLEPAMSLYLVSTVEMSWLQKNVVSGPRPRMKGGSRGLSAACSPGNTRFVSQGTLHVTSQHGLLTCCT